MDKKEAQPLKAVIAEYLKALRIDGKVKQVGVISSYEKVVGKTIAKATSKIYFRENILVLELNSSVIRNELYMHKQKLKDRLNEEAGENIVEDVVLK
ncbi:DUF721 domain-containing protein [Bacteroidota bacterium]